ncbi:hypothetical protein E4T38_00827 [Aureobasidium subglaciale]|nr:hypothetical protein E4T38_00827 [Aureobasidium subglaciale]KAI5231244.1 hypothetical protein E4T40_00828 [Aureobasidium subglaciale]KAI5234088.1 hypothetical protein E4T41_00826 [Aureobasidium subglaciale]KAI5267506.1 hypothetical protein E4T46_00826 [Aureobasidium subglaciale]
MSLSACVRRSLGTRGLRCFVAPSFAAATRPAALAFRPFSITTKFAQEQAEKPETDAPDAAIEATESVEVAEDEAVAQSTEVESVPWYLQVDTPTPQQEHPFAERQRLPELPESPPALLQPILEHVSVELGLDHLSLIDLRELDPPPALGANLLMVIGTARSEKHLHVSADRLCRWLRTEHRLTPYADGLLGRNELKLKLRRKAKRTRLLSAVGAKETASQDIDDGIRTGWVCVNVGKVEGGALQMQQEPENFVGFGGQSSGSRIVVQMMTDEKRGQIDLETLWSGILRRSIKAKSDKDQDVDDAETRVRKGLLLEESQDSPGSYRYRPHAADYPSGQQARAFHSSAKQSTQQGAQNSTLSQLNPQSDRISQSAIILNHMVDHVQSMSPSEALKALGRDSKDQESTPMLRAFYTAMPRFPETMHWHAHVSLDCHAVRLGHAGYTHTCLIQDLESMRIASLIPDERTYLAVLEAILLPYAEDAPPTRAVVISRTTIRRALAVLDRMSEDGIDPPFALNQLISALSVYALRATAQDSPWSEFWELWRSYPRRMSPRSSDMYVTMFDKVAERNSQKDAMDALRQCVPEMLREQPAVKLGGQVTDAVMRCLDIAEPRAEKLAREGNRGEWATLWLKCAKSLELG